MRRRWLLLLAAGISAAAAAGHRRPPAPPPPQGEAAPAGQPAPPHNGHRHGDPKRAGPATGAAAATAHPDCGDQGGAWGEKMRSADDRQRCR